MTVYLEERTEKSWARLDKSLGPSSPLPVRGLGIRSAEALKGMAFPTREQRSEESRRTSNDTERSLSIKTDDAVE